MPPDVRRLQSEQTVAEANVVLAHGEAVFVGGEHVLAEPGIPGDVLSDPRASARHRFREVLEGESRSQSHGLQNVGVNRRREVIGQEPAGGPRHE